MRPPEFLPTLASIPHRCFAPDMNPPIRYTALRIGIVEDKPLLRVGVRRTLEEIPGWDLCYEADSIAAARMKPSEPLDVLLLDLGLPDGSGLEVISDYAPTGCRVIIFSVLGDETNVISAIERGASGYLLKDASPEEMRMAIHDVAQGGAPLTPAVAAHLLRRMRKPDANPAGELPGSGLHSLTPRERDVLMALARGYSYDETAHLLEISKHTVGHHVKQIYGKLAVNSRSQAVFEAVQAGWLRS